tara:strand:- start:47 stop:778 length:732 start_codon:yes stop_codon:yes gene_type:complete
MLRQQIKIFTLLSVLTIFLIILKNGQIFDLGIFFRLLQPNLPFNSIISPVDDLEKSYQELLLENIKLKSLESENIELRELLEFGKSINYSLVVANILGRDEINKNILIIDIGKDKNISEGQAVVINKGIIIGKVIEVSSNSSKIRLLTDKESSLAVKIGSQSLSGILTGSLGLGMDLEFIPKEQEIKINDLVITSYLNETIPANLLIGYIEKIEFEKEDIFKKALISPFIDYQTLYLVAVINL